MARESCKAWDVLAKVWEVANHEDLGYGELLDIVDGKHELRIDDMRWHAFFAAQNRAGISGDPGRLADWYPVGFE